MEEAIASLFYVVCYFPTNQTCSKYDFRFEEKKKTENGFNF